jgi:hypothetical protein
MPRGVRVFIEHEGELRRACSLSVTNRDASVYLQPASKHHRYRYGVASIPPGKNEATFSVDGQLTAEDDPHVSLHQSGQVHIRTRGGPKAGPLHIPPLASLRGGHVASITSNFAGFPLYAGQRENLHPDYDRLVSVDDGVKSGTLAIYVNGSSPDFAIASQRIAFTLTVGHATLARPLHIAVAPLAQAPLGTVDAVAAIAGFQPDGSDDDFLFLHGL